ncbi:MAG: outer membrane protein [Paracoccaceae bacterium]|jgi:outer membrane protein
MLLLVIGATAGGSASAETLSDALVKAYLNHPNLASARAGLRIADEQVVQERAVGLGAVNGTASLGLTSTQGSIQATGSGRQNSDPVSLGLTGAIPIYSGGQVRYAVAGAQEGVRATRAGLMSAEQDVLLAAITAYEDVRRDISFVSLARNNVRVISEQVRAARDRFEVGEVTRTDVSQAEARLAGSRSNLAASVGALSQSRQAYLAAVGDLPQDLSSPPPIPPLPESEDAALALALAEHPDLVQARYTARRAEYDVKRAVGAGLPQLELRGNLSYSNTGATLNGGESNTAAVSLNATVPLWTGGAQPSAVRQAQASLAQRTSQVHELARIIGQRTSVSWSSLEVARSTISARREQIRAAQVAFDGVKEEATLGARTTLDVLDAEQELVSARAELVSSKRDEYVAAYALLGAVGKLTVIHLGLDVPGYDPEAYMTEALRTPYGWVDDDSAKLEGAWSLFNGRP